MVIDRAKHKVRTEWSPEQMHPSNLSPISINRKDGDTKNVCLKFSVIKQDNFRLVIIVLVLGLVITLCCIRQHVYLKLKLKTGLRGTVLL